MLFQGYTYYFFFFKQWHIALLTNLFYHAVSISQTQLPSYHNLLSETMKGSANAFRVWLHYHTSASVLTNPGKCKHSFLNYCPKINEWQQNAKSESKVTLCLIFSQCLKQNQGRAYLEFLLLLLLLNLKSKANTVSSNSFLLSSLLPLSGCPWFVSVLRVRGTNYVR